MSNSSNSNPSNSNVLMIHVRGINISQITNKANFYGIVDQVWQLTQDMFIVVLSTVDDAMHAWKHMCDMCFLEVEGHCTHKRDCYINDNGICTSQIGNYPCSHKCSRMRVTFFSPLETQFSSFTLGPEYWNFTNCYATRKMRDFSQILQNTKLVTPEGAEYASMRLFSHQVQDLAGLKNLAITKPDQLSSIMLLSKVQKFFGLVVTKKLIPAPQPVKYTLCYSDRCNPDVIEMLDSYRELFNKIGMPDMPETVFEGLVSIGIQNEEDIHMVLTEDPHELGEIGISEDVLGKLTEYFQT